MADKIKIGEYLFDTLVAITEEDHINGLMYKSSPTPIMSFPYEKLEIRKFWMKNTIAPLDIVFCRAGIIIDICYGKPLSLKLVGPKEETDLVIELPLGATGKFGINVGDSVELKYSVGTLSKKYAENLKISV